MYYPGRIAENQVPLQSEYTKIQLFATWILFKRILSVAWLFAGLEEIKNSDSVSRNI
jgi:hypothetical protein